MISRGSLWLPFAILLLLAALSFAIERAVQMTPSPDHAVESEPEGIMENFDALRTDANGRPHYRLSAKKLKHYTGSKLTELELPRFVQIDPRSGEIRASAREATVSPGGDRVDLRGDVTVVRAAGAGHAAMTLRTTRLHVFPEQDMLRAPGPVDIRDDLLTLRAGAMDYDARRRLIKLTGRVHTRYLSRRN